MKECLRKIANGKVLDTDGNTVWENFEFKREEPGRECT